MIGREIARLADRIACYPGTTKAVEMGTAFSRRRFLGHVGLGLGAARQ
jgi:hypothetical protein